MGKKKKAPNDKYRILKCPLDQLTYNSKDYSPIESAIDRTHQLVTLCSQFLRLYILELIKQKEDIPTINVDVINMAFKALSKKSTGPKPKGNNLIIFNKFKTYYDTTFKQLVGNTEFDSSNLSSVLNYSAVTMLTNIENNIKVHFINRLRLFVNQMFKYKVTEISDRYKGKKRETKLTELQNELKQVKRALENNTKNCDKKYHKWLDKYRDKILPKTFDKSYAYDVVCNPQKYLPYMVRMSKILEKNSLKQFQYCPLRTAVTSKCITLDTKALVELLVDSNKTEYLFNISKYQTKLWSDYFKTSDKIFKHKSYTFDHSIKTDGYSVSIQFMHNKYVEEEKQKKKQRLVARGKVKELYKNKTTKEIDKIKKKHADKQKKCSEEKRKLANVLKQREKELFNSMSKEEQNKVIQDRLRDNYEEFPYINELVKDDLDVVKNKKKVYIDPGKRNLFCMIDDEGKILKYTNRTRVKQTKRLKYARLRDNYKKRFIEAKFEKELSDCNSKTCDITKFKEYIKKKYEVNSKLYEMYNVGSYYKKLNWFSYMNTKRSESKLIQLIKATYGSDIIIIIGDWSVGTQMRNFMSTPNLGLKRVLSSEFKVYNVDEFRTSKLHYKTEETCKNLYLPDKKQKLRKMHSILTYKMENLRLGCVDRDKNGVNNIRKLVQHYLRTGERPKSYCRGVVLDNKTPNNRNNKRSEPLDGAILLDVKSASCPHSKHSTRILTRVQLQRKGNTDKRSL